MDPQPIPYIDLFAGAGGLGEGFSAYSPGNSRIFNAVLSVENNAEACETLRLRHFFRQFGKERVPEAYYAHLQGKLGRGDLFNKYPEEGQKAMDCVLKLTLANENRNRLNNEIERRIKGHNKWVLLGGPPCQAYSVVGRARRSGDSEFEKDPKQTLYLQYLYLLNEFAPPVFVMENVQGLLSARLGKGTVLERIMTYIRNGMHHYRLYSLGTGEEITSVEECGKLLVDTSLYGIPQRRKRLFILGIRDDIRVTPKPLQRCGEITVADAIGDLPAIKSRVSKRKNNDSNDWLSSILALRKVDMQGLDPHLVEHVSMRLDELESGIATTDSRMRRDLTEFHQWIHDARLAVIPQHEARSHMSSDLRRYFFASAYAEYTGKSPKLADFPAELLPQHKNVAGNPAKTIFNDRFRVQLKNAPSTTITAHIHKDGHYFIHYDPIQCRSFTVREAARLQTFPDNYFFEGNKTEQYRQIGNAVPPLFAMKIAEIVHDILKHA